MLIVVVYFLIAFSSFYILSMVEDSYFFQRYVDKLTKDEEVINLSREVIKLVKKSLEKDNPKIDYLNESWAKPITIPIPDGSVDITIVDQERYLNPNSLISNNKINHKYLKIFQRLYSMLEIDEFLIYNIVDWIDKNSVSDGGKEYYEEYKVKNDYLDSVEEILLIAGYSPDILYGNNDRTTDKPPLKEFLTVYSNGKININTAPKFVLMALGFDNYEVGKILEEREKKPFFSVDDFVKRADVSAEKLKDLNGILDVKSENFLVFADININDNKYKLTFLLKRNGKKFDIIWRKLY